jgi:hypothetical protein
MENPICMWKISESLDKNPSTSQKYAETVHAWIIVQMCILHG